MRPSRVAMTASLVLASLAPQARAVELVLFDSGGPQAIDLGDGAHYHGVRSILGLDWYPRPNAGTCEAVADYFVLPADATLTAVGFHGLLQGYGGGPGALHVYVMSVGEGGPVEVLHAWADDVCDWSSFVVGEVDPSGLGGETVKHWRVNLADLPHRTGSAALAGDGVYLLAIAGDDWGDLFHWAANAPQGLTGGDYDLIPYADTTDVEAMSPAWAGSVDLGSGAQANNLSFEIIGAPHRYPDLDGDGDVDQSDFGAFQLCYTEPTASAAEPGCDLADFNLDGEVDLNDHAIFADCASGAEVPAAAGCAAE